MRSKIKWMYTCMMILLVQVGFAQEKTLSGVVTEDGMPLPGVTVVIQGTQLGTQTDLDGKYTVKAKPGDVLVYSFIGMSDVTYVVGNAVSHNVKMEAVDNMLTEVVVTAYGTQTRASIAGSVGTVKPKDIQNIVTSDVTQGLTGKVSGVQIYNTSGAPGQAPVIRFRGIGSISASSEPLIVLDGVPFNGTMNSINNADIESISFLKDASAAALYGNRGANGVIIVTTKKGKAGKLRVTVNSSFGIADKNYREYNRLKSPGSYYEGYHRALRGNYYNPNPDNPDDIVNWQDAGIYASQNLIGVNGDIDDAGSGLGYNIYNVGNTEVVGPDGRLNPNAKLKYHERYDDFVFRTGFVNQNNVNISGGNENTTYYLSLGHDTNEGIVDTQTYEKTMARLNLDSKVNKTFKVGGNLSYANINQKNPMGGGFEEGGSTAYVDPFFWTNTIAPIYPVRAYDEKGQLMKDKLGNVLYDDGSGTIAPASRPFGSLSNPYAEGINNYRKTIIHQLFGTGYLDVNLYDGLTFKYVLSAEYQSSLLRETQNALYGSGVGPKGRAFQEDKSITAITHQQLLNYNKWFGQHSIDLLLGHESMERDNDNLYVHRTNMLFPDSPYIDHAAAIAEATGGRSTYHIEGYFAKLNYGYDNKYFLNASVRRDASSYFHPDNRWGTFFGIGGAWVMSQENFMKDISWLDDLKIKASYGEQGNDNLKRMNPYQDSSQIVPSFDGDAIATVTEIYQGNKDISWEVNKNFNAGFEASVLGGRLTLDVEYFERNVDNMLFFVPQSIITGVETKPYNAGNMTNKGFEISLTGDIVRSEDLRVSLNMNATHFKNKITKLPEDQKRIVVSQFIREEGGSVYDYYMKEYVGVNKENGNAQFVRIDPQTGEKSIVEDWNKATNQRIDKSSLPKLYGGFGLDVEYKGFDFNASFAYQLGGYGMDAKYYSYFAIRPGQNMHEDYTKTWTPENVNANMPMLYVQDPNGAYSRSTMHLIKSDYLSLQNITLGYTFDDKVNKLLGIEKLRLYALVDNPMIWSKRKGYDPRLNVSGLNGTGYSLYSTYMFGVNLTL